MKKRNIPKTESTQSEKNDAKKILNLLDLISQNEKLENIMANALPSITGGLVSGSLSIFTYLLFFHNKLPERSIIVFSGEAQAHSVYRELEYIDSLLRAAGTPTNIGFFPNWGGVPFGFSAANQEREADRLRALSLLYAGGKALVITSIDAISFRIPDPSFEFEKRIKLSVNLNIKRDALIANLVSLGYTRIDIVKKSGEFSVKGDVIDIFCPSYDEPIRIDFFDEEIESIRIFHPISQKSINRVSNIIIDPCLELQYTQKEKEHLLKLALESKKDVPPFLENSISDKQFEKRGMWDVYPIVRDTCMLMDVGNEKTNLIVYDLQAVSEKMNHLDNERIFLSARYPNHFSSGIEDLFYNSKDWQEKSQGIISFESLPANEESITLDFFEPPVFKGRFSQMMEQLKMSKFARKKIFFSCTSEIQKERLVHILSAYATNALDIEYLVSPLKHGFSSENLLMLTEQEIFGKSSKVSRISKNTTQIIESYVDLNEGDYVVHVNYGIGKFIKLKRMVAMGFERDFLEIEFGGSDKLYVPLEKLQLVHRYIGSKENPRLDFLGKKSSWQKTKARVQSALENIADELLAIYAKREKSKGFMYPKDTTFQEEFEAAFPYEETEHQLAAILDVKKDMESEKPMDRLICGDVGFGKTEVAIRAAFKAVLAGKQVAVLCPTTVLAFQHYHTFRERFESYPVSVDFISRFRTAQEVKKIKEKLKSGSLDVVIGTHSLFADIEYKSLGLLVIDEEQRFGVTHKESIKSLKSNIDCLTMTATPIPRTLHMSLVGIREISLIETPPKNRIKIQTYVLKENEEMLVRAIKKEIERNGQVYVLHNNVKTIQSQAGRIKSLYPQARVAILHGQMVDDEIENCMLDFYKQAYDVLISTTIIESGIDIPNVNTLIVLGAHKLGLSQLYQIKGRVGRSDRQAYAYFFYPAHEALTEIAQKRLNTLQEHDELGAGFFIAMKDLEIRGAGNILGKEQSGEILDVGFELYISMLQERIRLLRNEEISVEVDCNLILPQDFFFPDDYIFDTRQKMEFYKKLVMADTNDQFAEIEDELTDRFGKPPKKVTGMILAEKMRYLGKKIQLEKIQYAKKSFLLVSGPSSQVSAEKVGLLIRDDARFSINPAEPRTLVFNPLAKVFLNQLHETIGVLEYMKG